MPPRKTARRIDEEARKRGSQVYFITGELETTIHPDRAASDRVVPDRTPSGG